MSKEKRGGGTTRISACALTKKFGDTTVLNGIDLDIHAGEMFALLGPNGAGKTTLFSILTTLRKPSSGQLSVCGHDVVRNRAWVRKNIGIVFQEPAVMTMLSVRENLNLMARFYGLSRAQAGMRTEEILKGLELVEVCDRQARHLSGGQRRRLELARALIASPTLLCLDEATLGLDLNSRRLFWSKVRTLARDGKTVFFTTHYMEEADVADRIALIDKGNIIAIDTPQALKAKIGGGFIKLVTDDNAKTYGWLLERGYTVEMAADSLSVAGDNLAKLVPKLVRELPSHVEKVEVREPSLEDVFLRMTGRSLVDGRVRKEKKLSEDIVA